MSLHKYMHPRNKYKIPPNFKQLAKIYPEFHENVIIDLSGRLKFNFSSEESLCVLAKTLLKHDFDLDVEIPAGKLIPTLPLRLNYILWIEDLLKHGRIDQIEGIDIGTGAICIYSLLCAKTNHWKMTATEIDSSSIRSAIQNVQRNNLEHLISVVATVDKTKILLDKSCAFTICNPPFFDVDKTDQVIKATPPRNAKTGNNRELTVKGGEIGFVLKMIEESIELAERIKIYTTMLGQKKSLTFLVSELKKKQIENTTWTEFCQGHTKRWGLAWSFVSRDNIDLIQAPVIRSSIDASKKEKESCAEILFPFNDTFTSLSDITSGLQQWSHDLEIDIDELQTFEKKFDGPSYQLRAYKDTWSHARRKRRMQIQNTPIVCTSETTSPSIKVLYLDIYLAIGIVHDKNVKICFFYRGGTGGKNALETFKQFMINKLGIRDYLHEQSRRKRKRDK